MSSTLKKVFKDSTYFLCALFLLSSCSSPGTNKNNPEESEEETPMADTIVIAQMQFMPVSLDVRIGDTVIWINNDMVDHDITSDKKDFFYSDTIHAGKIWKMVVKDSAGYHCSIHPTMQGRLILK